MRTGGALLTGALCQSCCTRHVEARPSRSPAVPRTRTGTVLPQKSDGPIVVGVGVDHVVLSAAWTARD